MIRCEENNVDYVNRLSKNKRLTKIIGGEPLYQRLSDSRATTAQRQAAGVVEPIPDFAPIHASSKI